MECLNNPHRKIYFQYETRTCQLLIMRNIEKWLYTINALIPQGPIENPDISVEIYIYDDFNIEKEIII